MKKRKWLFALAAALAVLVCGGLALADSLRPTVIYDGATGSFSYKNTDEYGLFGDFQDLMPGDSRMTEIKVELRNLSGTTRLYLRAEPEQSDRTVLEPLTLSVSRSGILLDRQTGMNSLSRNTLLGVFERDASLWLDVALSVPLSVGNEAAEQSGALDWIFTVQTEGGEPTDTDTPDDTVSGLLNCDDHYAYVIGYEDGSIHPQASITRGEVAAVFFRLLNDETRSLYLCTWNPFTDVSERDWYNTAVSTLYNLGVVYGRTDDRYDASAPITRAEFAAIATRFSSAAYRGTASFPDIRGHWAEREISRAAALGWVQGLPDGTFQPERSITRAEAMTLINRVLRRVPVSEDDLLPDMIRWPDNKPSDWYYLAVQEATNGHDYVRRGTVNEKWTVLTGVPDWRRYQ